MTTRRIALSVGALLALQDAEAFCAPSVAPAVCRQQRHHHWHAPPHRLSHQARHRCCTALRASPSQSELAELSRGQLQDLAKEYGLKANAKSAELIEAILDITSEHARDGSHEPSVDDDEQEQPQQQQQQEEWTEDRISRKISVLQRKLRDVKALEVLAVTDPDSLNADQQVKLGRKASLAQEIAALEKARRQLQQGSAPPSTAPAFASAPAGDFEGEGEGEGDGEGGPQGTGEHLHGLPKKLGTVLSYCRVSTRETCEMLVAIGRVTVNGEVVTNADKKVDILNDEIIANGARVEIPDKFDNTFSAPPVDEGEARPRGGKKRTGPLPKSEKPKTWKQLTKYTWKVDGGLMARKVRGIKPKDGIFIDREDKPPRRDRRY